MNKNADLHELTRAEIGRQIAIHDKRRREIVTERAEIYRQQRSAAPFRIGRPVDDDERAARDHARTLLNGAAPPSLAELPLVTRDRELAREQRGLDIVLKILNDKNLVAIAVESVEWADAHRDEWRALCREIVLTIAKLGALEAQLNELANKCPDLMAVRLPLGRLVGSKILEELYWWPEIRGAAVDEGVVTAVEIKKASK